MLFLYLSLSTLFVFARLFICICRATVICNFPGSDCLSWLPPWQAQGCHQLTKTLQKIFSILFCIYKIISSVVFVSSSIPIHSHYKWKNVSSLIIYISSNPLFYYCFRRVVIQKRYSRVPKLALIPFHTFPESQGWRYILLSKHTTTTNITKKNITTTQQLNTTPQSKAYKKEPKTQSQTEKRRKMKDDLQFLFT